MKNLFFFPTAAGCLLLLSVACNNPQPRVIEKPFIAAATNTCLDIQAIDLGDSATVLTLHATYHPEWWIRLDSTTCLMIGNVKYPVLKSDSFEIGKKFWMPKSGEATFTLTFAPLPLSAESADFIEPVDDGFCLYGIDLTGKASPVASEFPKSLPKEIQNIDLEHVKAEAVMDAAETELRFHVLNYRPEYGKLDVTLRDLGDYQSTKIDLDGNGEGSLTTTLYGTTTVMTKLADLMMDYNTLLVAPGEPIDIYLDACAAADYFSRTKRGQKENGVCRVFDNGVYAALNRTFPQTALFYFSVHSDSTLNWRMSPDEYTEALLTLRQQSMETLNTLDMPQAAKEYHAAKIDLQTLEGIISAKHVYMNHYYNEGLPMQFAHDSITALPGMEQFKRVAEAIDMENPLFLSIPDYPILLDPKYIDATGVQGKEVDKYLKAYSLAKTGMLTDKEIECFNAASSPFYAKSLALRQAKGFENLQEVKKRITPTPDVPDDKLFAAIVEPYRGKVVLVDLWDTWCAPCRKALAANEPLKSGELADEDIVWIYLADETSDLGQYAGMIPDIKGIHMMLTTAQIATIRKQFEVDGIPFYILVNREGKAERHPDYREHDRMVKGIKAALQQ